MLFIDVKNELPCILGATDVWFLIGGTFGLNKYI